MTLDADASDRRRIPPARPMAAAAMLAVALVWGLRPAAQATAGTKARSAPTTAAGETRSAPAGDLELVRITPAWDIPDGWAVMSWDADFSAERVVLVRGTDRIEYPQPNWRTRDLFVVDEDRNARPLYGPEAGTSGDPISRVLPAISGDGESAVFATYRQAYPQGTDLRFWVDGVGQQVIAASGQNFDLDFPDLSRDGERGAFVEILPLTADNFVFRMRLHAWVAASGARMLAEYPNRHITGLAIGADGGHVAYCLEDFSEDVDRGEIRLIEPASRADRVLLTYVGVAGPVAVSADGSAVAAFLPDTPAELGGPGTGDAGPGVYLWREDDSVMRLDEGDGSADSRVPLTMSDDGTRVSWAGLVWTDGQGVEEVVDPGLGAEVVNARMAGDGLHWTVWLPDGPDGPGLYRLGPAAPPEPAPIWLPLALR